MKPAFRDGGWFAGEGLASAENGNGSLTARQDSRRRSSLFYFMHVYKICVKFRKQGENVDAC